MAILIADSGATKCEWGLLTRGRKKIIVTQGISPYFLNEEQITKLLQQELLPRLPKTEPVEEIYYYGTGMLSPANVSMLKKTLRQLFKKTAINISDDMVAAARGLNGAQKGIACNLGTGSFCCYYNGKEITRRAPGAGFILGDEGSGAYLGKKVVQYYLYNTYDEELRYKFDYKFKTDPVEILESVYRKPLPNRYLASFAMFLSENRGHYMIENIIEDGLNDFFFNHLCKFNESWKFPIHFTGSIAYSFKDVLKELCQSYQFDIGKILKSPMEGLLEYHGT